MRSKVAVIVSALVVLGLSSLWIAWDTPPDLPETEDKTGAGGELHERRVDSKREPSSRKRSPPDPSRATAPESGSLESEVARAGSRSGRTGITLGGREPGRRARAADAGDQGEVVHDSEDAGGSEEFGRSGQKLSALADDSQETPGDEPIEPDVAELSPEDVERLDLDGDRAISPWELATTQRLRELAERHPVSNDVYDGEYPVEREDYAKSELEFDLIDTNRDGLMDVDEYYSFLFDEERIWLALDADGDQQISRDESGLSEDDFATLDYDLSESLKPWEIRRGMFRGILEAD